MAKWNRGKKQRERRKFSDGGPLHPKHVITIEQTFENAGDMLGLGPFVRAEWSLPQALQERRRAEGLPEMGAIAGPLMLDTASEVSLISSAVVEALSLEPASNLVSPNSEESVVPGPYWAELRLTYEEGGRPRRMGWVLRVFPASGLEQNIPIPGSEEPCAGLMGVLGRDFLQHTVLHYDGPGRRYQLQIHTRSLSREVRHDKPK